MILLYSLKSMKQASEYIFYNRAVSFYLNRELDKLRKFLKSGKLSRDEIKLIQARLVNLDSEFKEALEVLNSIQSNEPFLMAQKYLVMAVVYGRQSMFQNSAVANQRALEYYKILGDRIGIFQSSFNLAIDYSRLSLEVLFEHFWEIANEHRTTFSQYASLVRAKASYLSKKGKYHEAIEVLRALIESDEFKDLSNNETFYNLLADILFRSHNYQESFSLYKELYKNKKSHIRPRIIYEYTITRALIHKEAIGNVHQDLQKESEYYLLWKTLLEFQNGEPDQARLYWNKLSKLNPDKYLPNLEFKDDGDKNNHFFQYYEFIKSKNASLKYINIQRRGNGGKLLKILQESDVPLRKEVLIEKIWSISYEPSFDARFYKLVERVKRQFGVNILMEKSTYRLAHSL